MSSCIQMQLEFKGPALPVSTKPRLQPPSGKVWGWDWGQEAETAFHLWPTPHTLSQKTWGKHYNLWIVFIFLYGCVDVILFQSVIKRKLSRLRVSLQTLEKSLKKKRNLTWDSTKWCVLCFFTHTCACTSENVLEMELLGYRVCFCYILPELSRNVHFPRPVFLHPQRSRGALHLISSFLIRWA